MSEKRRGLGRGLGALIPPVLGRYTDQARAEASTDAGGAQNRSPKPVDVFFADRTPVGTHAEPAPPASAEVRADDSDASADPAPEAFGAAAAAAATPSPHGIDQISEFGAGLDGAGLDGAGVDGAGVDAAPSPDATIDIRQAPELPASDPIDRDGSVVAGAYFTELELDAIRPNPRQPRQVFDADALAELTASITEVGLLQPVVVRPLAGGRYELVMGERRLRAAQAAGLAHIPAIVRYTGDDVMLRDALLENLHRSQLNALEEAAAYDQLLQDFGCTHEELATRLGRSRPQISNTLRLLRLPPMVQRRVAAGVLSAGHARALLALEDAAGQERLAQRIVAEGLSVRSVEEVIALGLGSEPPTAPTRARPSRPHAPGLEDLATRLSDRFDTRVKVDLGRRKGRITVDFASVADLERIVDLLAPDLMARTPAPLAAHGVREPGFAG